MSEIPSNVNALQFDNSLNIGHIEFTDEPNQNITQLPSWAITIFNKYDDAVSAYETEQAATMESYRASKEQP
jgi:hypothetical protein